MNKYNVYLCSVPGFYEQYDGKVEVLAQDDAMRKALIKLKQTSFPERSNNMWKIKRVEHVFN